MKVRLYLILLLFLVTVQSWAFNSLVFMSKDGTKVVFDFSERITITFSGNTVNVKTPTKTFECVFDDFEEMKLDETVTKIEEEAMPGSVTMNGDQISIRGLVMNTSVAIYSVSGQLLKQAVASPEGTLCIDISSLPKGTYVIKVGNSNTKFGK